MSRPVRSKLPKAPKARSETKAETRKALIQAGIEAFAEDGLDAPSLDAICERAGKTRGAFYVHFQDRDELLVAVMEEVLGGLAQAAIQPGGVADLSKTVRAFVDIAEAPRGLPGSRVPMHQFLAACARNDKVRKSFQRFLTLSQAGLMHVTERGQAEGKLRRSVAPQSLSTLLVALVTGIYVLREQKVPLAIEPLARDLLKLLAPDPPMGSE